MNPYGRAEMPCEDCILFSRSRDSIDRLRHRLTEAWDREDWEEIRRVCRDLGRDGPLADELLGISRSTGSLAEWVKGVKAW